LVNEKLVYSVMDDLFEPVKAFTDRDIGEAEDVAGFGFGGVTECGVDCGDSFEVFDGVHVGAPLRVSKNVARPVSIGRLLAISKEFGFLKSISAVETVWMVRFPPGWVWVPQTELK
jgi:hypothetical protein